jgi:hypothetical protein
VQDFKMTEKIDAKDTCTVKDKLTDQLLRVNLVHEHEDVFQFDNVLQRNHLEIFYNRIPLLPI